MCVVRKRGERREEERREEERKRLREIEEAVARNRGSDRETIQTPRQAHHPNSRWPNMPSQRKPMPNPLGPVLFANLQ